MASAIEVLERCSAKPVQTPGGSKAKAKEKIKQGFDKGYPRFLNVGPELFGSPAVLQCYPLPVVALGATGGRCLSIVSSKA